MLSQGKLGVDNGLLGDGTQTPDEFAGGFHVEKSVVPAVDDEEGWCIG